MKAAKVNDIKKELKNIPQDELVQLCLRLAKFKKENKELLTYLLYESDNESNYIKNVKELVDLQFLEINKTSYFFIKKSVRKVLRSIKKYSKYSQKKDTEVELHIYFCKKMKDFNPSIFQNIALSNLYYRQIDLIKKAIKNLHEDLQYDYNLMLEELD